MHPSRRSLLRFFSFFRRDTANRDTVSFFLFLQFISFRSFYFFIDYWYRKDFLIHFLRSSIFPFRRTCCANDFEKRRILYGILYGMDFHPSLVTNEKPWNWICGQWGKSGRVPTTIRYVWKLGRGGEGRRKRSAIWQISERKRIVDWLRVALFVTISRSSRRRGQIRLRWKGTSRGRKRRERGERKKKKKKNKRENSRARSENGERGEKREKEQRFPN